MNEDILSWFLSLFNLVYIEYYTDDYIKKLFHPTEVSDVEQQIKRMEWKKHKKKTTKITLSRHEIEHDTNLNSWTDLVSLNCDEYQICHSKEYVQTRRFKE